MSRHELDEAMDALPQETYAIKSCGRFFPYISRYFGPAEHAEEWMAEALDKAARVREAGGTASVWRQRLDRTTACWVDVEEVPPEPRP